MFVRNFTFKVSSQFLAAVMAFVSLLVMARYVANEYGTMMWGLALVSLINTVADIGFNSANLKFIAKKGYDQSACFSTFIVIKLLLTLIMIAGTVITAFLMLQGGSIHDEEFQVCLVFIVYQIISNVQFAIYYTLDGMMLSGKSSILTLVECSIRNIILIVMALYYVDAVTLSTSYVIATAISGLLSIYMIYQVGIRLTKPIYMKEYAVFAAPLAVALILASVVTNLDKVVIGLFYDPIEVSYYSTAVGMIATFTAVGVSLNNVLLPHLSKNVTDKKSMEKTLWGLERALCFILCPFIIFFMILGEEVAVVLFGGGFGPSGQMMAVLSIQIIPFVFAGIMTQVLYALNRGAAYMRASIVLCVVAVVGFFVLIPPLGYMHVGMGYGGVGAAASVVIAYVMFTITLTYMVKKATGYRLYPKLWKIAFAFIITTAAIWGLDQIMPVHGFIGLAFEGIVCAAIFLGLLYLMKELKKKDIGLIWKKFRDDED